MILILLYIRTGPCCGAVDNADLAKHGACFFVRLSVIWTVAVIYCAGSLLNGAAEEERGTYNRRVDRMVDATVKEN